MPRYLLLYGRESFGKIVPDKVILVDAKDDREAELIARSKVKIATPVIVLAKVIACFKLELEEVKEEKDVKIYSRRDYHRITY